MYHDLYVINGKVAALNSLLGGEKPSAEDCSVTPDDFIAICAELYSEGLINNANIGKTLNAEVTDKGINYINTIIDRIKELS